jgi:hypothetical protein
MVQSIVWGIVLYGVMWFLMYCIAKACWRPVRVDRGHLILLTKNSEGSIEWVIRSYVFWHWIQGKSSRITCVDRFSDDDTLSILTRLQAQLPGLEVVTVRDENEMWNEVMTRGGSDVRRVWVMDLRSPDRSIQVLS